MPRNLLLVFITVLLLSLLLPGPAAAVSYTNEMSEWIYTGGSGAYTFKEGSTIGAKELSALKFSDITRASTLNYVAFQASGQRTSLAEGSYPFSYTLNGETHDGVYYVDFQRNALGGITATRFTLFFYDWNIGTLTGEVVVPTNTTFMTTKRHVEAGISITGDSYVWFEYFPNYQYTSTVSSGIDWKNKITISDNYGGSDLNVALQREYGPTAYASTLSVINQTESLYSSFGAKDASLLFPADRVTMVTVTSPSGQVYSYPRTLYAPDEPEYSPILYGEVINVYTGSPVSGASITATQSVISRTFQTTSDASGEYSISPGPVAGYPVTVSASAAGYQGTSLSFDEVPRWSSWYVPLYLFPLSAPDIPTDPEKSMLYGYVITQGSQQPIQGATVTLSGVGSTTTSSTGFYVFNNISADTYTISASAPYHTPLSESVTVGESATQHNLALEGTHTLTVIVKDADDQTLVSGTKISLSDGQTSSDTNPAIFNVEYGQYTISVAAEGYYPGSQYVYVERPGTTTATVLLTPKTPPTPAPEFPNYPPHNVRFTVQTLFGAPISNVTVTAQGIQQTPSSNILERLLGINVTTTPINSELMSGTTDSNGDINFMMVEAVKYQITFFKQDVVNKTIEIYPKDDHYPIIIATTDSPLLPETGDPLKTINITVTTSTSDDTGHITVIYNDTTLKTTSLNIQVNQQTGPGTTEEIATFTKTNDANVTHTFDLSDYKGNSYFVHIEATHPDYGTVLRDFSVWFKAPRVPLGNLPDELYVYVAGFLLLLVGGIFTASSATKGVLVVAFSGWLFYAFGWLDSLGSTAPLTLSLVSVFAVIGVILSRYREEGYT